MSVAEENATLVTRLSEIRYFSGPLHYEAKCRIEQLEEKLMVCRQARLTKTIRDLPEVQEAFNHSIKLFALISTLKDVDDTFKLREAFEGEEIDALFEALKACQ